MSVQKYTANTKDVGGIPVARLLPQGKRKTVGAWCFLDHAGSDELEFGADEAGLQVGLHPHTNLQTFTWMLSGEVYHQDSLGHRQLIRPHQVNLMTAGTGNHKGISHTEQTPEGVKDLHAVQLWIALPTHLDIEPSFEHYPQLPTWESNGIRHVLTTGSYQGHTAPTKQYSPLVGVDMQFDLATKFEIEQQEGFEYGLLVLKGTLVINGQTYAQDELAVLADCVLADGTLDMHADKDTHVMLLGGEPLPHPTVIWWNFVADNVQDLELAVKDWNDGHERFGDINLDGTALRRLVAPDVPERIKH